MINKVFKYSLIALLTTMFLFVATGYNYVQYCCAECESIGVEALLTEPCHNDDEESCCTNNIVEPYHEHHSESCSIEYVKIDDTVFTVDRFNFNTLFTFVLAYSTSENLLLRLKNADIASSFYPPDNPFYTSGREILSSVCILRI